MARQNKSPLFCSGPPLRLATLASATRQNKTASIRFEANLQKEVYTNDASEASISLDDIEYAISLVDETHTYNGITQAMAYDNRVGMPAVSPQFQPMYLLYNDNWLPKNVWATATNTGLVLTNGGALIPIPLVGTPGLGSLAGWYLP